MNYGWLNIGSVLLGLIALIIPIVNLMREDKSVNKNLGIFSGISISACATSLCMQIFYTNHLVNIKDFTAMMDLLGIVASVSAVLLIATIILNALAYIAYSKNTIS